MAQVGRRGSLKNCIVKVRVLLPALMIEVCGCGAMQVDAPVSEAGCWRFKSSHPHQVFVGVAQLAERELAKLEVGSSNLLADSIVFCTLGRVGSGAGPQPLSGRFDSVSVLQFDLPKWRKQADARSLNLRHLRVRVPPSALSVLRVGKCSVRSHKPRLAGSVTQTRNQNMGRWASPVKPSVFQAEDRGFKSHTPYCV